MVLQTLTGIIYEVTAQSWTLASIAIKYYLVVNAAYLYKNKGLTKSSFKQKVLGESRLVIGVLVGFGAIFYALSLELSPFFTLFSEATALSYLGFLFWKY